MNQNINAPAKPLKATSDEVTDNPYWTVQMNDGGRRFMLWLRDKLLVERVIMYFVNRSNQPLQCRLRIYDENEQATETAGTLLAARIKELLTKFGDYIFHDGGHDFMLRNTEDESIFVYDSHGIIYIYGSTEFADFFMHLGVTEEPGNVPIHQCVHVHYRDEAGAKMEREVVRMIGGQ